MKAKPTLRMSRRIEPLHDLVACPSCGERLPTQEKNDAWIVAPIDVSWNVGYRVVMGNDQPVVAELRVFPAESQQERPGEWSGDPGTVPVGGVPGASLRRLRVSDATDLFHAFVQTWEDQYGGEVTQRVFARHGLSAHSTHVPRRPGRAGRPDEFYARWAAGYVARLRSGSRHPIKDLAMRPPVAIEGLDKAHASQAHSTAAGVIQEARRRGLLSQAPAGKAGGELTTVAIRLLAGGQERPQETQTCWP